MAEGSTAATRDRSSLMRVALPTEHGGWSLTLEPVLLGLIVAPSWAGLALGGAALTAFLIRTPLKLAIGDRLRGRVLPRTRLATRVAAAEALMLSMLLASAAVAAQSRFWLPLAAAAPLFAVEMWFDVRSKGRHLAPELAGTVGIGAVAAAIALAGGADTLLAWGVWIVAGARAVAAIPFVRVQLRRAKAQPFRHVDSDAAQAVAAIAMGVGFAGSAVSLVALVAILALAAGHVALVRLPPPRAPVLGTQQVVLGLAVVVAAGLGAIAP